MDHLNIGIKLQEYRQMRGFSIRELSQKTGITPSMLSQVERDITNPSINTLRIIAQALEIPLYYFFKEDEIKENPVVKKDMRKRIGLPGSEVSYELLTPDTNGEIEFCQMQIPAGGCSSEYPLNHKGEEAALLIQGTVTIYIGETIHTLAQGDSIVIGPGENHRWVNTGNTDAVVIFAVTPPTF